MGMSDYIFFGRETVLPLFGFIRFLSGQHAESSRGVLACPMFMEF